MALKGSKKYQGVSRDVKNINGIKDIKCFEHGSWLAHNGMCQVIFMVTCKVTNNSMQDHPIRHMKKKLKLCHWCQSRNLLCLFDHIVFKYAINTDENTEVPWCTDISSTR